MFLEALLRFSSLGLLFGLAVVSLRDRQRLQEGWLLSALCVTLMALMISTASSKLNVPAEVIAVCRFIDTPNTVLAWLFVKSLLNDNFKVDRTDVTLAMLYCVPLWFMWLNVYFEWGLIEFWHGVLLNFYAIGLFTHLFIHLIRDWPNDLVESRRKLRFFFVATVTLLVAMLISTELFAQQLERELINSLKVFVTLLLTLFGFMWFLQVDPAHKNSSLQPKTLQVDKLKTTEAKLYAQLNDQLIEQELWRDPNLTIAKLAKRIGIGEHKLRAFINKRLGYRNFSEFLQTYRLAAIKRMLADPAQQEESLLSIAFACGFNSTSTFNRVFRQMENVTPSEYRESKKA